MDKRQERTHEILMEMRDFLIETREEWSLYNVHRDGRINSAHDEDAIVKQLRKKFGMDVFVTTEDVGISNRGWWDIWFVETDSPVNVKSSNHKSADNACNFLAMLWSLTDVEIEKRRNPNAGKDTTQYIESLQSNTPVTVNRDYWFFSVNKKDPSEITITSVRSLKQATLNSNNLPFQINWSKNHELKERTVTEAREYYNDILKRTLEKDWRKQLYEAL